jgi:hypothetical protein
VTRQLQPTAGITMLAHLKNMKIKVLAPFILPRDKLIYYSGKTNGVMLAHIGRNNIMEIVL